MKSNNPFDKRTACRSCGKTIVFLKTAKGHNMPVDAESVDPADTDFDSKRHTSHFQTCEHAAQHRRAKVKVKP